MFLSKSDEEISVNRKLAKELVDKWVSNTCLVNACHMYYYSPTLTSKYMFLFIKICNN